jgi:hypothetical protein
LASWNEFGSIPSLFSLRNIGVSSSWRIFSILYILEENMRMSR